MRSFLPCMWSPVGEPLDLDRVSAEVPGARCVDISERLTGCAKPSHGLRVVELPGGKIIDDLRLAATAGDHVISGVQSLFGWNSTGKHYLLTRRRLRLKRFTKGRALLLGVANADNYYHWLLDSLPRWRMLMEAGFEQFDHVLMPAKSAPFQEEMMEILKIPAGKLERCEKRRVHSYDSLVVPSMPFPVEEPAGWAVAWIRSLLCKADDGSGKEGERIYLSRQGKGRRPLTNEAELERSLAALGFEVVVPEEMTLSMQSQKMSRAQWLVAPHGAGLVNMIFMPPGGFVLELNHPGHMNRCYVNLAAACGHRHAALTGQGQAGSSRHQMPFQMDVAMVCRSLEIDPGRSMKAADLP